MNYNYPTESESIIKGDSLASMIDHTLLKPDATREQVEKICWEAMEYKFASVCVNSCYIPLVVKALEESGVKACSVVGFPLGAASTAAKAAETEEAVRNGAEEIDMVVNIGALKSGSFDEVRKDIKAVVDAAGKKALVKVIIETCLLTDEEKIKACVLARESGADFVKTSTGFSTGGATAEDIGLMRKTVGPEIGVKASGGIRDYETAVKMIKAGANRIGASASVSIIKESIQK